jgi:hypothetical protein
LIDKVCRESEIFNVKAQLQSSFSTDTSPGYPQVDGVVILAFGKALLPGLILLPVVFVL